MAERTIKIQVNGTRGTLAAKGALFLGGTFKVKFEGCESEDPTLVLFRRDRMSHRLVAVAKSVWTEPETEDEEAVCTIALDRQAAVDSFGPSGGVRGVPGAKCPLEAFVTDPSAVTADGAPGATIARGTVMLEWSPLDFTVDGEPVTMKGDKGDPLTWNDLTPEQKAELKGEDGLSAYEVAVAHGYTGTEEEWYELVASAADQAEAATAAKLAAQSAAQSAVEQNSSADAHRRSAGQYAAQAMAAQNDAIAAKNQALEVKAAVISERESAESAATNAGNFRNQAATSASTAANARTAAQTAQGKAETAQGKAEVAQTAAEAAQTAAETAQTAAEAAQTAAEAAQAAAEAALPLDTTLAISGKAADAKAVGDAIADAISAVKDSAPEAFDTLKEIADWIEDDQSGAAAMAGAIATHTTQISALDSGKVDKVPGKGLSTNDYTTAEKEKLGGVETGAQKTAVATTWAELKALRDEGLLAPGCQYRITDYVATVNDAAPGWDHGGDPYAVSANHPFDIVVTADSESALNEECRAVRHDGDQYFPSSTKFGAWRLWYSIDNDATRFEWSSTDALGGKGVVYRLIDEWGNDLPYDFKGIKTRLSASPYWDPIYTFGNYYVDCSLTGQDCLNVVQTNVYQETSRFLPDIHFYSSSVVGGHKSISISCGCNNIFLDYNCSCVAIGADSSNIKLGAGCYNIAIGNKCEAISLGNANLDVEIGGNCRYVDLNNKAYCRNISISSGCSFLRINPTSETSFSNPYRHVVVEGSLSGTGTSNRRVLTDARVGQTQVTIYSPSDALRISV